MGLTLADMKERPWLKTASVAATAKSLTSWLLTVKPEIQRLGSARLNPLSEAGAAAAEATVTATGRRETRAAEAGTQRRPTTAPRVRADTGAQRRCGAAFAAATGSATTRGVAQRNAEAIVLDGARRTAARGGDVAAARTSLPSPAPVVGTWKQAAPSSAA